MFSKNFEVFLFLPLSVIHYVAIAFLQAVSVRHGLPLIALFGSSYVPVVVDK